MNRTDFYSNSPSRASGQGYATGPTGPNQSVVTQGNVPQVNGAEGAPFAWVGLMTALVIIYVAIRFGGLPRNG